MHGATSKHAQEESHFGTTVKRFRDDGKQAVPGPGSYIRLPDRRKKVHREEHFGSL